MSANLAGLHDRESVAIAPSGTWAIDTVALSESPQSIAYPTSLNWIARLNWGYGSTGTLPLPDQYAAFAQAVVTYVAGSSGCRRWIIGNEPNLPREWPNGQPIYPWHYAACYKLCRQAIHALPGHAQDEVLIASSGPWNDKLKYSTNPNGDWIVYFRQVIDLLGDEWDGAALHAYTHGYDPALVTSTARMDAPFQAYYYNFRTYQDYMAVIPPGKTAYLTEANGDGPWQAVGLMPAMLAEIDGWNHGHPEQPISCVVFFRYPKFDQYFIAGRDDVIAEYRAAVGKGYQSPMTPPTPTPQPPKPEPEPPTDLVWDKRLDLRGCTLTPAQVTAGQQVWRVIRGQWFDPDEAQGRVNIFVRLLDANGQLAVGVPVTQFWSSGSTTKPTEHKSDPWLAAHGLGADYSLDFPMTNVAPAYGVQVEDGKTPSDKINGCGLGSIKQPNYKIHTCYFFEYQLIAGSQPQPPEPPIPPLPNPSPAGQLLWPVTAPITQRFGENPQNYAQFGQAGHDGIDLGCPQGTAVQVIADGEVMFTGTDADYGNYVRVWHPSLNSHSFYAHLSAISTSVGQKVRQGDVIAKSGATGNVTGPHLHLELRGGTRDSYLPATYGYTQGRYDPMTAYILTGSPLAAGAG